MAFDLDRLEIVLVKAGIQTTNNPLYQVILQLIRTLKQTRDEINATIVAGGSVVTGLENGHFLTHTDESVLLPQSRQLIPGTNITFDDTVANQRTINAAGSVSDDYVVMSDGATPIPAPIDDGFGNFVYIMYTP